MAFPGWPFLEKSEASEAIDDIATRGRDSLFPATFVYVDTLCKNVPAFLSEDLQHEYSEVYLLCQESVASSNWAAPFDWCLPGTMGNSLVRQCHLR